MIKSYQDLLLKNYNQFKVYDQSGRNYSVNKEIIIKTPMLRSDLCDFSDACIAVKGTMTLGGENDANKRNKSCI